MSSFHVVVSHGDRKNKVHVEVINNICYKPKSHDQASVFKVSQLDIHSSEFYSPSDVRVLRRWWLEPEGVPVCRLKVFEMRNEIFIIDLFLNMFSFVRRNWVSGKQSGDVLSHSVVKVWVLFEDVLMLLFESDWFSIIMSILNVLMVWDVMVHGTVSGFWNVFFTVLRVSFFSRSAIDTLFYNCPSKIIIWELTFLDWSSSRKGSHDTSEWKKHIMEVSCVINGLALICNLKAALPHTKMHGIHINFSWVWLRFSWLRHVCEFILVDWHSDLDFLTSFFSNRFDQSSESGVRVDGTVDDKLRFRWRVNFR